MRNTIFQSIALGAFWLSLPVVVFAQYEQDRGRSGAAPATAEVGKPAPSFALKDLNGKEHKLSDYSGKVVVIEWSNHQCPFCVRHAKERTAEKVVKQFEGKPVVWVGIDSTHSAPEMTKELTAWKKEHKLSYPLLIDADGAVGKAYGAKTTPHVFIIDQKGKLVYSGAIDDDPVGMKEAKRDYVVEALEAIFAGTSVPTATTKPYGCPVKYKS